jgi:hypothetical protein
MIADGLPEVVALRVLGLAAYVGGTHLALDA